MSKIQQYSAEIADLEAEMKRFPAAVCPVTHRFTPGIYARTTLLPAGTLLTSMEHKTEHPFVITEGRIGVTSGNEGQVIYEAPYIGVTKPGTKRVLYAFEDTVWTTFHATNETDVEKIAAEILEDQPDPDLNQWRNQLPTLPKP